MRASTTSRTAAITLVAMLTLGVVPASAAANETTDAYVVTLVSDAASRQVIAREDIETNDVYTAVLSGFSADLTTSEAASLAEDPRVLTVEPDAELTLDYTSQRATDATVWGIDRLDQPALPLDRKFRQATRGEDVIVYVIDSGVNAAHAEFEGRVAPGWARPDLGGTGDTDCNGHGTHVAGIVAGRTTGVAPAAKIVPVRIMDCDGQGTMGNLIAGLDWVVANHPQGAPGIVNMSLGAATTSLNTSAALTRAASAGLVLTASAGNSSSTGTCEMLPAGHPQVLAVGSTDMSDNLSVFSNFGSCVDVYAPGSSISSASFESQTGYLTHSGTSMAAPHVAGVAALHLSENPGASESAVRSWVVDNAVPAVRNAGEGARLAQAPRAPAEPVAPPPTVDPPTEPSTPLAPVGVKAQPKRRKAVVSWTEPLTTDAADQPVRYRVRVREAGTGKVVKSKRVGAPAASTTVARLRAGRVYTFEVASVTAAGMSPWSDRSNSVKVKPQRVAPRTPKAVSAKPLRRAARVAWTPAAAPARAKPGKYVVTAVTREGRVAKRAKVRASRSAVVLRGLGTGSLYSFRVVAVNRAGRSKPTASPWVATR